MYSEWLSHELCQHSPPLLRWAAMFGKCPRIAMCHPSLSQAIARGWGKEFPDKW